MQPIEKLSEGTSNAKRVKKEEWWMKELKTLYPYGLNDKCNNTYFSNTNTQKILYSMFNKYTVQRGQRGNKTKKTRKKKTKSEKIQLFVKTLERVKNDQLETLLFYVCNQERFKNLRSTQT